MQKYSCSMSPSSRMHPSLFPCLLARIQASRQQVVQIIRLFGDFLTSDWCLGSSARIGVLFGFLGSLGGNFGLELGSIILIAL